MTEQVMRLMVSDITAEVPHRAVNGKDLFGCRLELTKPRVGILALLNQISVILALILGDGNV